jgi:2'-5' RNA ligase
VAAVVHACRAHRIEPILWTLDRIGRFARAGVVWAGGPECRPMLQLMRSISRMLDALGIEHDRRSAVPHVTLLRDARVFDAELRIEPPIVWALDALALYASDRDPAGTVYRRADPP